VNPAYINDKMTGFTITFIDISRLRFGKNCFKNRLGLFEMSNLTGQMGLMFMLTEPT